MEQKSRWNFKSKYKEEFLSGSIELLGYLKGKLHNHDITIEVVVNETTENKYAFTPQREI